MIQEYPVERKEFDFADEDFEHIKEIIVKIRNIRAEMNVPVTKKLNLFVAAKTEALIRLQFVYRKACGR